MEDKTSDKKRNAFLFYDSKTKVTDDQLDQVTEILKDKNFDVHVYEERVTFIQFLKSEVSKMKPDNNCTVVLMITKNFPSKIFRTFDVKDLKNVLSSGTNAGNHPKYLFFILQDKYPDNIIEPIPENAATFDHKNYHEFKAVYERSMPDEDFDEFFNGFCNCMKNIDRKEFNGQLLNTKTDYMQKIKIDVLNELQ